MEIARMQEFSVALPKCTVGLVLYFLTGISKRIFFLFIKSEKNPSNDQ